MTLNSYHLKTLFDLREQEKKKAELFFAQTQAAYLEQKRLREILVEKLLQMKICRENFHRTYFSGAENISAAHLRMRDSHIKHLRYQEELCAEELFAQKKRAKEFKKKKNLALTKMLQAAKDFKLLEKHRQKWQLASNLILQKKDEDTTDEISLTQFLNQRKRANHVPHR